MAGKKQNVSPMWKNLMKLVDLGEPTSFLDNVYLGHTQRECKPNENIIDQYREMFESRISAAATERLPGLGENLTQKTSRGPATWKDNFEKSALKDIVRWHTKKVEQFYKVSCPCLDDHKFKQEELESVGELSQVCLHIVLKCLYLARMGRYFCGIPLLRRL